MESVYASTSTVTRALSRFIIARKTMVGVKLVRVVPSVIRKRSFIKKLSSTRVDVDTNVANAKRWLSTSTRTVAAECGVDALDIVRKSFG